MITLVPYVKASDGYTVTDEAIRNIWNKLRQDGTDSVVFYEGGAGTFKEFLEFFKRGQNLIVLALVDGQVAGFAWINGINQGFAFGHFVFFKEAWGKSTVDMGKQIVDYWLSLGDKTPVIRTIIGMIPEFNSRAIEFVKRLGFNEVGKIPKLIHSPIKGQNLNIVLFYYQR